MQGTPIFLAKKDAARYVVRCNRNVFHLNWFQAMLHLTHDEFAEVAEFLFSARSKVKPNHYCGNQRHFVMECPHGYCQMWLMGLGLHMPRTEYDQLTLLVDTAYSAMEKTAALHVQNQYQKPNANSICHVKIEGQDQIHINWSQATLCLSSYEFLRAAQFLQNASQSLEDSEQCGDNQHFIVRDERGFCQLWLQGMGLYLDPADFSRFINLVNQAEEQLQQHIVAVTRTFPNTPLNISDFSFSEN